MASAAPRQFWENSSARLAARINLAVWLEHFAPAVFAACSAGAVAVYAVRRTDRPVEFAWIGLLVATATLAAWSWRRSASRRYRREDARVLLESALRLDARLSAAAEGVGSWPKAAPALPPIVTWRALTAPAWLLGALLLLAAGAFAPLAGDRADERALVEKPPALAQTEAMLQELAKLEVADPATIEQLAAQARELATRPTEEQYTHSALEAADALRDQTLSALQNLARGYDSAAAALGSGREAGSDENSPGGKSGEQLSAALDGLRSGRLAGHPELLAALAAAEGARGLSAEQQQQLRERLREAGAQARGVGGAAGAGARIAGPGEGTEGEGEGYGRGGVSRGRGDAPLTMTEDPSAANDGRIQGVSSDDFSRAALGDLTGTERGGAHDFDPTKAAGPQAAGSVATAGRGGEAVWVDRLPPADRAVLRDFFK